jgi:hypothetical protein
MRECDAVRRAAGPHRQVQPFLSGCGIGSRRISPSIDQLCVRSRGDSTLRRELPTARCGLRITFVSSKWTTRKVDQVPNTEAFANLPQLGSGGHKETAQQSIRAEALHPLMPALGDAIQPFEDPDQLGRERKDMHFVGRIRTEKYEIISLVASHASLKRPRLTVSSLGWLNDSALSRLVQPV